MSGDNLPVASANVELVRSIFAGWERGDYSSVDWADREIEYVVVDGPEPGSWTGRAGMAATWRTYIGNWQDARAKAEEYRELPDDRVLVLTRWIGRGKTSGLEIGMESGLTCFARDQSWATGPASRPPG